MSLYERVVLSEAKNPPNLSKRMLDTLATIAKHDGKIEWGFAGTSKLVGAPYNLRSEEGLLARKLVRKKGTGEWGHWRVPLANKRKSYPYASATEALKSAKTDYPNDIWTISQMNEREVLFVTPAGWDALRSESR